MLCKMEGKGNDGTTFGSSQKTSSSIPNLVEILQLLHGVKVGANHIPHTIVFNMTKSVQEYGFKLYHL